MRNLPTIMINPQKHYTLYEILQEGLIPDVSNYQQLIAKVKADAVTNRYLDAVRIPRGDNGVQYRVLGANIIKYLASIEALKVKE